MKWRMKLADWMSGGELSRRGVIARQAQDRVTWRDAEIENLESTLRATDVEAVRLYNHLGRLQKALQSIADMETPRANATVCRMANVAREALK